MKKTQSARVAESAAVWSVRAPESSGSSIRSFCECYGVTREAVTRMTGFSPRAVANWSAGQPPGRGAERKLTELSRLFGALAELVDTREIDRWLGTANPAFEGSTPLQVIERGETDRIWRMIWELEAGNVG